MTIHLYAEHLMNIRSLSLQASLSTVSNKETRATLSADGSTLTLAHEGEVATIKLPISLPGGHNDATLTIPAAPTKDLSFRVSLSEKPGTNGLPTSGTLEDTNVVPWTAPSLTPDTEIACRTCGATIVERSRVKVWKDLPSENWAEMMDFWHCHRPNVPHDDDHSLPRKGYSADSRLALEPGVGMIDPVDFILTAADCSNVAIFTPSSNTTVNVDSIQCTSCSTPIGRIHSSSEGYKIRKLHLSVSTARDCAMASFDIQRWLACHLLSSMESQGVRKFTIQKINGGELVLKLWIFTPDISISSSAAKDAEPIRCTKILWKDDIAAPSESGALNRQALAEGELELPSDEMQLLRELLAQSAALLPQSAKTFQSWNVALLQRFTRAEGDPQRDSAAHVFLPEVPDVQNKEILSALTS
ncbi:Hypothetical predicted protein [Lecanosticta acicola]|uniref:Ubiquitin-conjugating enzyme E2C-binding protein n=1 Tax=Lecanosticta acicola TaxID=111012 RepID=A0AAI8Z031_9PEZI|nr:Hypothetical predicted protein [Lecanosticta acicola]